MVARALALACLLLLHLPHTARGDDELRSALEAVVRPHLQNLSAANNRSAWSFAYYDDDTSVALCEGRRGFSVGNDASDANACEATDLFAFGSSTKPFTSVLINTLAERGLFALDDAIAPLVQPVMHAMSNGTADLVSIFGAGSGIEDVTVRQVLHHRSGIQELSNEELRAWVNAHPAVDLDPLTILRDYVNHTLLCKPGTCGVYSSSGYTLLGFVAASALNLTSWDQLVQRVAGSDGDLFPATFFPTHGPCGGAGFVTADGRHAATVHGYEHVHHHSSEAGTDVWGVSCSQGWTCGNMVATPSEVARFFFKLLTGELVSPASLRGMMEWQNVSFSQCWPTCHSPPFSYGQGLMRFDTMDWGFESEGDFIGHNGLTYGFGAQSGYNVDLKFAVSWVNNVEAFVGPEFRGWPPQHSENALYKSVADVVRQHRSRQQQQQARSIISRSRNLRNKKEVLAEGEGGKKKRSSSSRR